MGLLSDKVKKMDMFYGKPVKVHQLGSGRYAVVNPSGDAELGNWVICECFWEKHANDIATLINQRLEGLHAN